MSRLGNIGGALYRGEIKYDFVGHRRRWYAISGIILIVAMSGLLFRGLNLGIEFKGGSQFTAPSTSVSVQEIRTAVEAAGAPDPTIIQGPTTVVQTTTLTLTEAAQVATALAKVLDVPVDQISTQLIGPSWGGDITTKAVQALVAFLIAVSIFLALYFEWRMAIAGLVALIHDIVITVGIYALTGFEVTPATVVGILTILGFSLYDTVVVFDKVKENTRAITSGNKMTYSEAANLALNQTLVRSINTSVVALLPVASILIVGVGLLGAGTLKDLALALFVGMAAGTYSSIFIATPFVCQLKERQPSMKALAARVAARKSGLDARPTRSAGRKAAGGATATAVLEADADSETDHDVADADLTDTATTVQASPDTPAGERTQPRRQQSRNKRKR